MRNNIANHTHARSAPRSPLTGVESVESVRFAAMSGKRRSGLHDLGARKYKGCDLKSEPAIDAKHEAILPVHMTADLLWAPAGMTYLVVLILSRHHGELEDVGRGQLYPHQLEAVD